jgi:gamma-glutamyl-gamma-aminobutyrate hydrolase PuuD
MKIGLTQRILYHNKQAYDAIEHGWYTYLKQHTLVPIPNITDQDFKSTQDLDALIITGGDDSSLRRTVELKISTMMMQQGKPVLGICHGAFLLADVLGADIVSVDGHRDVQHKISYFGEIQTVNSYHDLAICTPHRSATVLCVDPEGHCEAWIDGNLAGVVWHPERMQQPWMPDEITQLLKL